MGEFWISINLIELARMALLVAFGAAAYSLGHQRGRRDHLVRIVVDNRADAEVNMTVERVRG